MAAQWAAIALRERWTYCPGRRGAASASSGVIRFGMIADQGSCGAGLVGHDVRRD